MESPLYQDQAKMHPFPRTFAYGAITTPRYIYAGERLTLAIAVFHPHGLSAFFNIPASDLVDQFAPWPEVKGNPFDVNTLNAYFISRMRGNVNSLVEQAVDFIANNKGTNSVAQLMRHTGLSQRQIERQFHETIGLGPKRLGNIVRVSAFLKNLKQAPNDTLTSLALDSGFFDQAHLIREFKKTTGITPLHYKRDARPLALNLIRLSGSYNFPA